MVTPGHDCPKQASPEEVAKWTIDTFDKTVPKQVPGIVFLSGGMSEEAATCCLNAINKYAQQKYGSGKRWALTFSYGRALQRSALETWAGKPENIPAAKQELLKRAKANWEAVQGKYQPGSCKTKCGDKDNFFANRVY